MKVQCCRKRSAMKLVSAITLTLSGWAVASQPPVVVAGQEKSSQFQIDRPLIQGARLYKGVAGTGPSLELGLTAYPKWVPEQASLVSTEAGAQLSYETIPATENLEFYLSDGAPARIALRRARVVVDSGGELANVDFAGDSKKGEGVHLVSALERSLKTLADKDPAALSGISSNGIALVTAGKKSVHLTIYRDDARLPALVDVVIHETKDPVVRVLDPEIRRGFGSGAESLIPLKVVGLVEYGESRVSSVVTEYLKDVVGSVQKDGILKSKLHKLGYLGEAAWSQEISESLGKVRTVNYNKEFRCGFVPLQSGSYRIRFDEADKKGIMDVGAQLIKVLHALQNDPDALRGVDLSGVSESTLQEIQFSVPDSIYNKLADSEYSATVALEEEMREAGLTESVAAMIKSRRLVSRSAESGSWLYDYVTSSLSATLSSALFGGAISAGLKIYDKYQDEGRLPGSYTEEETRDMALDVAYDAGRHAVTGFAVHNMRYQNVPVLVAATVAGVGNHLYDRYRGGTLNWNSAPAAVLESGAESLVSGIAGTAASWVASTIPGVRSIPAIETVGALSGSLVGHYIYQYSVNHGLHEKFYNSARQYWTGMAAGAGEDRFY